MNNYSNLEIPLLLKDLKNLTCLEIGVERGGSAYNILKNCDVKMMYLLDPYLPYTDLNDNHICDLECQKNNKFICNELLKEFSNFKLIEKTSDEYKSFFEDETFDYIFIDGLHTYDQCIKDLENYYPKLKPGGLFSGHDYSYIEDVNKAVNEFSKKNGKKVLNCKNDVWYWYK